MILFLSDLWVPFPGGAERLAFNLARDLHRRGHDVQVVTSYEAARQFDGPPVYWADIGVHEARDDGAITLAGILERYKPDVIVTHALFATCFEEELAASEIPLAQLVLNTRRLPGAALAVYISEYVKDQVGGAQPGDLVVTPPAFEDVIAGEHGEAIGFIKPYPHKGVDLVYVIAERMPDRDFLILRGEWPTLEWIRDDIPNVKFMQPVPDIRDFYRECRLILMPSVSEDAGTVAQEATLNGLPCISSNVGGLPETNRGGVVMTTSNPNDWVREIRRLDQQRRYDDRVTLQRQFLDATFQTARLDQFAEAITRLEAR